MRPIRITKALRLGGFAETTLQTIISAAGGQFRLLDGAVMAEDEAHVSIARIAVFVTLISSVFVLAGCTHKLVGRAGESTVNVFPSKHDFDNVMAMKSRGGAEGMVGGLGESFMARKIAQDTR